MALFGLNLAQLKSTMKKLIFCILLVIGQQVLMAQKVYFVYLQSENRESFYLKMGGKTYNSGTGGYLILSKLRDSVYHFTVGSAENKFPEQPFTVTVNKKDHGYLFKNFGETGWGLFDLQSMEVLKAGLTDTKKEKAKTEGNKNVSLFTEVLAKASDDPSLKEITAKVEVKKEIKKPDEKLPEEKTVIKTEPTAIVVPARDTQALVIQTIPAKDTQALVIQTKPEKKKDIPDIAEKIVQPVYKRSDIKRRAESSTTEGMGIVYTDDMGNDGTDTIRILIPAPKIAFSANKDLPKEEKKFLDVDSVNVKDDRKIAEVKTPEKDSIKTEEKKAAVIDCREKATQDDFFKVRKNMAAVTSDDEMIEVARQVFQTKCFSTLQIKNLGTLFLNEEGKFQFYLATKTHVSDKENFASLQSEFKEEKYIQLFKALIF